MHRHGSRRDRELQTAELLQHSRRGPKTFQDRRAIAADDLDGRMYELQGRLRDAPLGPDAQRVAVQSLDMIECGRIGELKSPQIKRLHYYMAKLGETVRITEDVLGTKYSYLVGKATINHTI